MLKIDEIKGTRATPRNTNADGYVTVFSVGNDNAVFPGRILEIGDDDNVYAVFENLDVATYYQSHFVSCEIVRFCNSYVAFRLDRVH